MQFIKKIILFSLYFITFQVYSEIDDKNIAKPSTNISSLQIDQNSPLEIFTPKENTVFKRGNIIEVRWSGGNPDDEYALDLFDGKYHYRHIGELKNSGVYPWSIPGGLVITGVVILIIQNGSSDGPSDLPVPIEP